MDFYLRTLPSHLSVARASKGTRKGSRMQHLRSITGHQKHCVLYHVNSLGALHLADRSIYYHLQAFRNLN